VSVAHKCNDPISKTTLELDSHADTCILGRHALITLDYNRPVSIIGYDEALGTGVYPTVTGAVAYTNPLTGRTLHLVINQAIHILHIDHHPHCPMQCRVNDVLVDEMPKFLAQRPTDQTHALTLTDPDDPLRTIILPLELRGVTLLLYVRNVTPDEYHSGQFTQLHLTSETLTWDLQTTSYAGQELAMTDHTGQIIREAANRGPSLVRGHNIEWTHRLTQDHAH
jgi:hypothetical protein